MARERTVSLELLPCRGYLALPKEVCSALPYTRHTQSDWEGLPGLDAAEQARGGCRDSVVLQGIGCKREGPGCPERHATKKRKQNRDKGLLESAACLRFSRAVK